MPPKKNSKASSAATPTRSSRSQTKAGVSTIETTATVDLKKASTVGKRKRTVAEVVPLPSDSDSEEAPEVRAKAKMGPKKKAAASPTKKARTTISKKKANTPFSLKTCENWFESLEDPQSTGNITYNTIPAWLNELGISTEGIIFYIIAWICKAKQTFIISKEEFLYGMGLLSADSNEALIRKLPPILKEVYPLHSNKSFTTFYIFCFNYFKPVDVKNLAIEVAQELFTSLLDINRYSLNWTPEETASECEEKETDFPHRKSFVEFLSQSPLQVITRDQYEQFLPFNKHMPWDFAGFNEEESTWPTLMDNYIAWRKEKYPLVGAEKVEA